MPLDAKYTEIAMFKYSISSFMCNIWKEMADKYQDTKLAKNVYPTN